MLFLPIETKDFITTKNACLTVKVRGILEKGLICFSCHKIVLLPQTLEQVLSVGLPFIVHW